MFRRLTATLVAAFIIMTGLIAGPTHAYASSTYCGVDRVSPASWTVTDSSYSNVTTKFNVPSAITSWTAALTSPTGRIPVGTSLVSTNKAPHWNMVAETLYKWGFRAGDNAKVTFVGSRAAKDGGQCTQVLSGTVHLRSATAVSASFVPGTTTLTVRGTLKRTDWKSGTMALFANRTVKLRWRKSATVSTWTTKATVRTNTIGKFVATAPRAAGQWRIVSEQTATYAESSRLFSVATS